jgi:hypothetical protein
MHARNEQQQRQRVLISNRRKVDTAWTWSTRDIEAAAEKKKETKQSSLAALSHNHSPWQQEHQSISK